MYESLINERYENLKLSIKDSLHRMKNDGLVSQLEQHKTSTKFASNRLYEVLKDFMDCWRERYIQKLHHDSEEAEISHDQILYKLQRVQTKLNLQNKEVISQTKAGKKKRDALASSIKEIQHEIKHMGKGFNEIINRNQQKIFEASETLDKLKDTTNLLKTDIKVAKSKFSTTLALNMRDLKLAETKIKEQALNCVYSNNKEVFEDYEELKKAEEIKKLKATNNKLASSLKTIVDHINSISSGE